MRKIDEIVFTFEYFFFCDGPHPLVKPLSYNVLITYPHIGPVVALSNTVLLASYRQGTEHVMHSCWKFVG